ncbi:MAG: DEAD/DEAH box helicase [Acidimicrobiales bacterium]
MGTLSRLLGRLDTDSGHRGRQFEAICRWFLTNDPVYKQELCRVWLWDEWPGRWGADAGIDLVAEDHMGRHWAIQAKAYDPKYAVTKADVDSFLSESNRREFSYRLLIATTDRIGVTARRTLEGQEKQVGFVGLSELEDSELDWPTSPADLRPRPLRTKKPRKHQSQAVAAAVRGFEAGNRGQLVMACGTGKTLVALFTAESLVVTRTLVLLPSLSLLSQTLREWMANASSTFMPLAVCSDDTVADRDSVVATTTELGMPVTTDPAAIAEFLRSHGRRVVFATYQSSPRIAEAYRFGQVPDLDLVVADEAHRCAGRVSSEFATVLDASAIPARRRLFMTATPRYFTGKVLREAREADLEVASMDDESVFGPVFHRLTFGEAIARDLLSDYQVVVVGVNDATYRDWVERGRIVSLDGNEVTDARTLAGQIGMAKAIRDHNLRRSITFHSRVAPARRFARTLPEVIDWMPDDERPDCSVWSDVVSGEMSAGDRNIALRRLRELEEGTAGVLTNARCLSEGVDVPTLDGVAFIDPRRSEVDIVQAVGRAIRKADDKTVGTVVIPVFIGPGDDPEVLLDDSTFRPVWDVLKALRAHDEELANELDSLRGDLGRGATTLRLPSKIHLDLPARVPAGFAAAFSVKTVEATTRPWEFWFGLLERHIEEHSHARVERGVTYGEWRLGSWVTTQRSKYRNGLMSPERIQRLEALPEWSWKPHEDRWEFWFALLQRFVVEHGHSRVPNESTYGGHPLGGWVREQRSNYREELLIPERRLRLEAVSGWTWDLYADAWMRGFEVLRRYSEREGHCRVHDAYAEDGFKLGKWVGKQRAAYRTGRIGGERQRMLDECTGWSWEPHEDRWEEGFAWLQQLVKSSGSANCAAHYVIDGFKLGQWCGVNRTTLRHGQLSEDRQRRLEALPDWRWQPRVDTWEPGFERLRAFAELEGHCRVPQKMVEADGFRLGQWVQVQRTTYKNSRLHPERIQRLEMLPGWAWNPYEAGWEEGFRCLVQYAAEHGDARPPQKHADSSGFNLGTWVTVRRRMGANGKLDAAKVAALEALPGWVWDSRQPNREAGYQHLLRFIEREGHPQVPAMHVEGGFRLGQWVYNAQARHKRGRLPDEQARRLEALPGWTWQGMSS